VEISLKFQVCLVFLFCFVWQNAYSQLLYQEKYKEAKYFPPYDPNVVIISPKLKKWMDDDLVKVSDDELGWTALMTAEEISALMNNYKELAIEGHREVIEGAGTNISSILSTIQLSTLSHYNGYDGDGMLRPPLVNSSNYMGSCSSFLPTSSHHNIIVTN